MHRQHWKFAERFALSGFEVVPMLLSRRREISQKIRGNMKKKVAEHSDDQYWEGRIFKPNSCKILFAGQSISADCYNSKVMSPGSFSGILNLVKFYKKFNDKHKT
jgi:hypothetical protein